jgi:hypothetical protein
VKNTAGGNQCRKKQNRKVLNKNRAMLFGLPICESCEANTGGFFETIPRLKVDGVSDIVMRGT